MSVTVQGVTLDPSEMSETETALLTIVQKQQESIEDLEEENEEKDERLNMQSDLIHDLKDELAEYRSENEKDKAEIRQKVTEIEETPSDDSNPGGNTPETALEEKVTLSDDSLDNESANAIRAIKVAEAIHTGGTRPSGNYLRVERVGTGDDARYMAKSRNVKKALEGMGVPGHDTTVKRVMKKLAEMGGDRVEFEKRRGTNRVYFDIDLVNHIQSYSHRCEPGKTPTPSQNVSTTA